MNSEFKGPRPYQSEITIGRLRKRISTLIKSPRRETLSNQDECEQPASFKVSVSLKRSPPPYFRYGFATREYQRCLRAPYGGRGGETVSDVISIRPQLLCGKLSRELGRYIDSDPGASLAEMLELCNQIFAEIGAVQVAGVWTLPEVNP
jgi:hypothetical protein